MKNVNLLIIRDLISEQFRLDKITAYKIAQFIVQTMITTLQAGGSIKFRHFGTLKVVRRKPKLGRNPQKPEDLYMIPEHKAVKFIMSENLVNKLNPTIRQQL